MPSTRAATPRAGTTRPRTASEEPSRRPGLELLKGQSVRDRHGQPGLRRDDRRHDEQRLLCDRVRLGSASIATGTDTSGNPILFAIGTDHQLYEQEFDANGNATSRKLHHGRLWRLQLAVLTHDAERKSPALRRRSGRSGLRSEVDRRRPSERQPLQDGSRRASTNSRSARTRRGNPEIFVVGLDNYVYILQADATGSPVSGYSGIGGPVESITMGSDASGNPLLFAIGTDNQVYGHKYLATGAATGSFFGTGSGAATSISLGFGSGGNPELYAILTSDSQVYTEALDPTGSPAGIFNLNAPGAVAQLRARVPQSGHLRRHAVGRRPV